MKIQLISNGDHKAINDPNITINPLSSPRSLDEFDVDIIDLSTPSLWHSSINESLNPNTIYSINDLKSIQQMVDRKRKAVVLYLFPANENWFFNYSSKEVCNNDYRKPIKDCLRSLSSIVSKAALPLSINYTPVLIYENTTTAFGKFQYKASFYFEKFLHYITKSIDSEKVTTVVLSNNIFLTTLQILESQEKLTNFINCSFLPKEEEPEWVKNIAVLNDKELEQTIESKAQEIEQLKKEIEVANSKKRENARIKSILYTNGDQLVEVVFEILEKLLSCDLSTFEDEKKEDFCIRKDNYTLVGEIKGVTSNIKNEHLGQLEHHYQEYMDELEEKGVKENVHPILIMNPFKTKPLSEREPVTEKQINLAIRNGSLIVETKTLLKLYEKFVAGDIDVAGCERLFTEKTGLLEESDF